jgi:hypothetical protein
MLGGGECAAQYAALPFAGVAAYCSSSPSQNVNTEHPGDIEVQKHPSPEDLRARVTKVQLQKDSKELSELGSSIPADMNQVQRGLLPKDIDKKLRRLEKLSKNVREELAPG